MNKITSQAETIKLGKRLS